MSDCISCQKPVASESSSITYSECEHCYHVGKCSGVTKTLLKSMPQESLDHWVCNTCKLHARRSSTSSLESQSAREGNLTSYVQTAKSSVPPAAIAVSQNQTQSTELNVANMLVAMNAKLDTLLNLKATVDGMEHSLQHMPENYDDVLKRVGEQHEEIKDLKKRVTNLEKSGAGAEIDQLKQKVHDLERRNRKQNLEIHGIPSNANEDLMAKLNELAGQLDVPDLTLDQVVVAHRLASRPDKTPGIIVRFASQATRDLWLDKRANLNRARSKVYISENLTQQEKSLLWETKEWAKAKRYQFVWYRNGKVFVREKDGARSYLIATKDDLSKLD